jgi:DNA-binding FadR family transcriptional regulator
LALSISRTEEVTLILQDEILRGQYRPGERLPSERDVATRFETSRGTVREAFKKLDQLGIASVQPGGARVVAVEECTLDVLGPLLDLNQLPDPALVEEVMELLGLLAGFAARSFLQRASETEITEAKTVLMTLQTARQGEQGQIFRKLLRLFVIGSDRLVLRLITNGLRMQMLPRIEAAGLVPAIDLQLVSKIAGGMQGALDREDLEDLSEGIQKLVDVFGGSLIQFLSEANSQGDRGLT